MLLASHPPFFLEHTLWEGAPGMNLSIFSNLSQTFLSTSPKWDCASEEAEKSEQTLHSPLTSQECKSYWGLLSGQSELQGGL